MSEKLNVEKTEGEKKFERKKEETQWTNRQEKIKSLVLKFSEKLQKDPIIVYVKHSGFRAKKNTEYDKITDARTDTSGSGGGSTVFLGRDEWISVGKDGFNASTYFRPSSDYYKITNGSFQTILTMMDELIRESGYTETEKTKMFKAVVDGLKNKIIEDSDITEEETQ